jgi:signal transduction histidine kinase
VSPPDANLETVPDQAEVPEAVKALLEATTDAALVLDGERRIRWFNRAYQLASGGRGRRLAQAVAEGRRCYEVFPLDVCETACVGCRARDLGRPLRVEMVNAVRDDGEELVLAVSAAPVGDGLVVETYRDTTAEVRVQRRFEALLADERRARELLEEEVRRRTAELLSASEELKRTHAQLIHQEKMSSLGRLVAGVAHELNNPINFVYGNVDFLGRYMDDLLSLVALYEQGVASLPPDLAGRVGERKEQIEFDFLIEDSRKLIRSIRSGAERTASIVRDLKVFSRTQVGALQDADVVAGIETTLNLLAPLLKNRIRVEKDFAEPRPRVVCHAGHINQVMMNILTNAAQAIAGAGVITVKVAAPAGGAVRISITDTGRGIPPEIQEKIFDPFFTTKDVGEGTGLGLAISESIVRAHGGSIEVHSEPGKGSTFVVTLPVNPPPGLAGEPAGPPADHEG